MMDRDYSILVYVAIYAVCAIVTNIVIYLHDKDDKDQAAVNLASILWPVTWAICAVLLVENGIKKIFFCAKNRFI